MQLLAMKSFLLKLKCKSQQENGEPSSSNGRIVLNRKNIICHEYPLADKLSGIKLSLDARINDGNTLTSTVSEIPTTPGGGLSGSPSSGVLVLGTQPTTMSAATSLGEYTMPERNYWQGTHIRNKKKIKNSKYLVYRTLV